VPIAPPISEGVFQLLVMVPGTRDWIKRELHGVQWGYHYHYLDAKNRRSDTLLTFDRDSKNPINPNLCWERHAEGDKIRAKANLWGCDKRQSVYSVCYPDIKRFTLSNFKRPATDAAVVWPWP
jgi:hypothetical protein